VAENEDKKTSQGSAQTPEWARLDEAMRDGNSGAVVEEAEVVPDRDAPETDKAETDAPEAAPAPDTPPRAAAAPPAQRRGGGGFVGAVIGGILAAGIGYGAAYFVKPEGWPLFTENGEDATLSSLQDQIAALRSEIAELPQGGGADALAPEIAGLRDALMPELSALQERVGALSDSVTGFDAKFAEIDRRLEQIAKAEIAAADGEAASALADYESRIESLTAALDDLRAENAKLAESVDAVSSEAEAQIGAVRTQAQQVEARAAIMRVDAALANGTPFADALGGFGTTEIPEALGAVAEAGVPTLADLQRDYPEAARAALDAALEEEAAGDVTNKVSAFLRSQLGVRSLEPREGEDADAVLSRAEAALRDGDLRAALSELDALPERARENMSGWIADATARADAVEAAGALEKSLNTN